MESELSVVSGKKEIDGFEVVDSDDEWTIVDNVSDGFVLMEEDKRETSSKVVTSGKMNEFIDPQVQSIASSIFYDEYLDQKLWETAKYEQLPKIRLDQKTSWKDVDIPWEKLESKSKLKFLIRKGIPSEIRPIIWKSITGVTQTFLHKPLEASYVDKLSEVFGNRIPPRILKPPLFGADSIPFGTHFLISDGPGGEAVKRILCILGMDFPSLEYCPPILHLVIIFMQYMSESETYYLVKNLIEDDNSNFLPLTKKEYVNITLIFSKMIQYETPKLWRHMQVVFTNPNTKETNTTPPTTTSPSKSLNSTFESFTKRISMLATITNLALQHPTENALSKYNESHQDEVELKTDIDQSTLTTTTTTTTTTQTAPNNQINSSINYPLLIGGEFIPWFERFFFGILPYCTALRVLDSYLNEGFGIIYRIGLAILKMNQNELLQFNSKETFLNFLTQKLMQLVNESQLMKTAFGLHIRKRDLSIEEDSDKYDYNEYDGDEDSFPLTTITNNTISSVYYRPKIDTPPKNFPEELFEYIYTWLPNRYRILDPQMIFNTEKEGYSMRVFYSIISEHSPTMLILRTQQQHVFGLFLDGYWEYPTNGFVGSRDSFLFSLVPTMKKYSYQTNQPEHILCVGKDYSFTVGIGRDGVALRVDEDWMGNSENCTIFGSPPMNGDTNIDFTIVAAEAYAFV
eukprot:TRINITY_DN1255_c0_g2_i1.p1 TRINITY_DN1255_c0_g2~~TRINITY_DN1255_c0_g2_i1.p1  ORF type:complete len:685 (+),score=172.40 TRINITY_DN1255_c0_g2_i1:1357-3411(+)